MIKNKKLLIILIATLIIALVGIVYWYNSRNTPRDLANSPSIGQQTKGEDQSNSSENSDAADEEQPSKGQDSPKALIEPSGNFVSSHEVNMDSMLASSCTTSAGVTCTIVFTKGSTIKSLPEQTTDSEGATFWEWAPKQIGLSTGEWTIEAKASNGTDTKTAKDASILRVQ